VLKPDKKTRGKKQVGIRHTMAAETSEFQGTTKEENGRLWQEIPVQERRVEHRTAVGT